MTKRPPICPEDQYKPLTSMNSEQNWTWVKTATQTVANTYNIHQVIKGRFVLDHSVTDNTVVDHCPVQAMIYSAKHGHTSVGLS